MAFRPYLRRKCVHMNTISAEAVEQTRDWLDGLEDEAQMEGLVEAIAEEQPFLFTYLLAMGEGDFNEDEQEVLLYLGVAVWQMMKRSGATLEQVSESHLDRLEQQNMQLLEDLSSDSETGFLQVARNLTVDHEQPELLSFVVEAVFEEEAELVRPHNQGIMVIFLKIVIDCLDEASAA